MKCGNTYIFTGDIEILQQITTKEDAFQLQPDIHSLQVLFHKWLLKFNLKNVMP